MPSSTILPKCTLKSILLGCLFLYGVFTLLLVIHNVHLYNGEIKDSDNNNDLLLFVSSLDDSMGNDRRDDIFSGMHDGDENTSIDVDSDVHADVDSEVEDGVIGSPSTEKLNRDSLQHSNVSDGDSNHNLSTDLSSSTLPVYNETTYNIQLKKALEPRVAQQRTAAYLHVFWSGFCNQYNMFSGVLLLAKSSNYTQIIVQSIRWKDLFGTNQQIRHDFFFDVVHWNTFYPKLPRFISFDGRLQDHSEIQLPNPDDVTPKIQWKIDNPYHNATKPFAIGEKRTDAIMKFYDYTKDIAKGRAKRGESELLMMKTAFRPHPAILDIMSTFKREHMISHDNNNKMMVLHARIEPDMQKHPMCKEHKVLNITDIVQVLYDKYPNPPVSTVLIILNRAILEKEVDNPKNENEMATHNLKTLNEIIKNGLWDGRVKVVEAGSGLAKKSRYPLYSKYSSLVGSIINFFLSLEADIFVGTIVSSYSTAVISYRFFREKKENYFYFPKGLNWVTPPEIEEPPRFAC